VLKQWLYMIGSLICNNNYAFAIGKSMDAFLGRGNVPMTMYRGAGDK